LEFLTLEERVEAVGMEGRAGTLARGLSLLSAFDEECSEMNLAELARAADLPKPTVLRLLRTLEEFGFVSRNSGLYRVGYRCLMLGTLYELDSDVRRRALPTMRSLMERVGEVVQLGVMRDSQVLYLERVQPRRSVAVASVLTRPGVLREAHCTALGKAMLAYGLEGEKGHGLGTVELVPRTEATITSREDFLAALEVVRGCGYATDTGECDPEVNCVAAPVFGEGDQVVAALSISAPSFRMPAGVQAELGELVKGAAREISHGFHQGESRDEDGGREMVENNKDG
jgi:IclR family acetate operon transcriptional repressor